MHCGFSTVLSCLFVLQYPILHLHFSPTDTNINRELLCCLTHNWSKFLELTWFSLPAVPPHLQLRTSGSLYLLCAISESTTQLGFKGKVIIINCMHWKSSSAPWSGSRSILWLLQNSKSEMLILKHSVQVLIPWHSKSMHSQVSWASKVLHWKDTYIQQPYSQPRMIQVRELMQ